MHPDSNPFCLVTKSVDGKLVSDQCDVCEEGRYLRVNTGKCEQYTNTIIENCFHYYGRDSGPIDPPTPTDPSASCMICKAGKAPKSESGFWRRRILESVPAISCMADSTIENCELTYLNPTQNPQSADHICLSCKEDKYLIDGACTGNATEDFKGCYSGTATSCTACNPYFDYVMYLPGKCAKKTEITEEFMIKAREIAAYSQKVSAISIALVSLAGLLLSR